MQRRNVDLPDPDGPIRQSTSRGATSRSMPFNTSSRPNRLRTPSAWTIGVPPDRAVDRAVDERIVIGSDLRCAPGAGCGAGVAAECPAGRGPRRGQSGARRSTDPVSYTHLRAHETRHDLV